MGVTRNCKDTRASRRLRFLRHLWPNILFEQRSTAYTQGHTPVLTKGGSGRTWPTRHTLRPAFLAEPVDLPVLLELVQQREGDRRALEGAIRARYFEDRNTRDYNKGKLANNVALGMIAYGIIDRGAGFTDLGKTLSGLRPRLGRPVRCAGSAYSSVPAWIEPGADSRRYAVARRAL